MDSEKIIDYSVNWRSLHIVIACMIKAHMKKHMTNLNNERHDRQIYVKLDWLKKVYGYVVIKD